VPRRAKRDRSETAAAAFLDPRSFWSLDGRLFLYGKDWGPHRERLFERTGGHCERITCGRRITLETMQSHHYPVSRGKGGSDDLDNLVGTCHFCHKAEHQWRRPRFGEQR
jgi:5-methylcytosine-specific restriction endonuclease McrA